MLSSGISSTPIPSIALGCARNANIEKPRTTFITNRPLCSVPHRMDAYHVGKIEEVTELRKIATWDEGKKEYVADTTVPRHGMTPQEDEEDAAYIREARKLAKFRPLRNILADLGCKKGFYG